MSVPCHLVPQYNDAMNRKPSNLSSLSVSVSVSSTGVSYPTSHPATVPKPSLSVTTRIWAGYGQRLKTVASDPNLLERSKILTEKSFFNGRQFLVIGDSTNVNDAPRVRRMTLTSSGRRLAAFAAVSSPQLSLTGGQSSASPYSVLEAEFPIGRRIVDYMPELYEEVDPIRFTGKFYTWDEDPRWLDYVPLPPPPRKNVKCGRLENKPKNGLGVCSLCCSEQGFSCGSSQGKSKVIDALELAAPSRNLETPLRCTVLPDSDKD